MFTSFLLAVLGIFLIVLFVNISESNKKSSTLETERLKISKEYNDTLERVLKENSNTIKDEDKRDLNYESKVIDKLIRIKQADTHGINYDLQVIIDDALDTFLADKVGERIVKLSGNINNKNEELDDDLLDGLIKRRINRDSVTQNENT